MRYYKVSGFRRDVEFRSKHERTNESSNVKDSHLLTLQASTEEHPKPPPPIHGSLNVIVTETLRALVKDAGDVTCAVGGIVSAEMEQSNWKFAGSLFLLFEAC